MKTEYNNKKQLGIIGIAIWIICKNITIITHIKIFNIWMKSGLNYLFPIININKRNTYEKNYLRQY